MMPAVASAPAVSRSTTTTLAPLLAKASAVARPMPLPAPVISATLPVKSSSIASLPYSDRGRPARYGPEARSPGSAFPRDLPGPGYEIGHHVADEALRRLIQEVAVLVEL